MIVDISFLGNKEIQNYEIYYKKIITDQKSLADPLDTRGRDAFLPVKYFPVPILFSS